MKPLSWHIFHKPLSLILFLTLAMSAQAADELLPVPGDLVGFCRWTVQDRAVGGLKRIVRDEKSPKFGTIYGGRAEDANIAWVAAAAYRYRWSRSYHDPALRDDAFFLMDHLAKKHANGLRDERGLDAYFWLHSYAWAVKSWLENEVVDEARAKLWRDSLEKSAEVAMDCMQRNLCNGQYANPEFYYLSGLAAAAGICNRPDFQDEAREVLTRYENVLWPGGGVAYFHRTSPEHGYQQMVTKSVVLYWLATEDPYGKQWLRRLAPYFVNVQQRSGLVTDAEHPWLKHSFYNPINPAVPGMLACLLDDGANRWAADVAARTRADNVAERLPSFLDGNPYWYNYHHTTYAAVLLRLLEDHQLPEPDPPSPRRVMLDHGFFGPRSQWDDFAAAVGTRQKNSSLAGAYIADPKEPMLPLDSALDGVFAEILQGPHGADLPRGKRQKATFNCLDWEPEHHFVERPDFAAVSCLSKIVSPYWNDHPWIPGERWDWNQVADWSQIQHWAVWRDHLLGFVALRCHADGGKAETEDVAHVRWRFAPVGRDFAIQQTSETERNVSCGRLRVRALLLGEQGGFAFRETEGEAPPHQSKSLTLARPAPWQAGDHVAVAIDARPDTSDTQIHTKMLTEGAAMLMIAPNGKHGVLWVASLARHFRQHHLDPLPGVRLRRFERDVELTPPRPGRDAVLSLHGAESAILELESDKALDPAAILAALHAGWGRGERRP
jgi:hypothetical protein